MPLVIQNDESSTRLQRQFRIVGRTPVVLDEVIVPTTDVGDFRGFSPFEPRIVGADSVQSPAGGAGAYSGVLITPGVGRIVVVESLYCYLSSGTGVFLVKLMRPADVAAVTVTSGGQAIGRLNGRIRSTGFVEQVTSTYSLWHHTTVNIGGHVGHVAVPAAGQSAWLGGGRGVVLDGSDPRGPISLAVQNPVVNTLCNCGFQLTEYAA